MSRIDDVSPSGEYEKLPEFLIEYEEHIALVEDRISISGKSLEQCNVENSSWFVFYDQRRIEVRTVLNYVTTDVERTRGKLYKSLKEGRSNRELSSTEINQYINAEPAYIRIKTIQHEVDELYEQFKSVVAAFTQRGYSLNNIVKARVAQMEAVTL